jgi:hypothetical protein
MPKKANAEIEHTVDHIAARNKCHTADGTSPLLEPTLLEPQNA